MVQGQKKQIKGTGMYWNQCNKQLVIGGNTKGEDCANM